MDSIRKAAFVANTMKLAAVASDWKGVDAILPVLGKMREEGAVIIVKMDGQRIGRDATPYTVAVLGEIMKGDPISIESGRLEDALARAIVEYAKRFWEIQFPPTL